VVAFGVGRDDAEYFTKIFSRVERKTVRQDQREEHTSESIGMSERWEEQTQNLYDQWQQEAFVSINHRRPLSRPWRWFITRRPRQVLKLKTPKVVYPRLPPGALERVRETYLHRYFRSVAEIEAGRLEQRRAASCRPAMRARLDEEAA
jgi:hypothetical protein